MFGERQSRNEQWRNLRLIYAANEVREVLIWIGCQWKSIDSSADPVGSGPEERYQIIRWNEKENK